MNKIRKDLIEKELDYCYNAYHVKNFKYKKLSNKFIDWIFNHYYCLEMCENFYDDSSYFDNKEKRIEFCNWQEPYFKGNWDMSQKYVNNIARYTLKKEIRNVPNIKDRLFVSIDKDKIRIYWYGRDIKEKDYWFIFLRKEKC